MTITPCAPEDIDSLRELAVRTFCQTFAETNTEEDLRAYLDKAFGQKLDAEYRDQNSSFFFLRCGGVPVGYLKLNEAPAQTDLHDPRSLEVERIYVEAEHQGCGGGRLLLGHAVAEARRRGKAYVWLGVWEKNEKALRFYKKQGFRQTGSHLFLLGGDAQTDLILQKDV